MSGKFVCRMSIRLATSSRRPKMPMKIKALGSPDEVLRTFDLMLSMIVWLNVPLAESVQLYIDRHLSSLIELVAACELKWLDACKALCVCVGGGGGGVELGPELLTGSSLLIKTLTI